jgi:hypothetical protein
MWKQTMECSGLNEPPFDEEHFSEWFDWFDGCMSGNNDVPGLPDPPPIPPCRPRRTVIVHGACYEIVCTIDGPELRPCPENPQPVLTGSILIIAIRITNKGFVVQTLSSKGIKTDTVKQGKTRLKHLGAALIYKKPLPAADVKKIPKIFWKEMDSLIPQKR